MMPEGLVSVVIPAHNAAAVISEALQSVREQTQPAGEIIVVDDGSTDNTEEIVEAFKDAVLLRQSHQGAAEARNAGARRATKPYLAFLDADDLWPPNRLEKQLDQLAEEPALDFVSGSMVQFKRSASGVLVALSAPAASRLPSVLLMRREAFWKVGPFSARWEIGETVEWWSRAVDTGLHGKALPHVVLLRRIHSDNLGKTAEHRAKAYLHMLHSVVNRRRPPAS
jgi:glycosyltransferase involved in cell wall biosynthesis